MQSVAKIIISYIINVRDMLGMSEMPYENHTINVVTAPTRSQKRNRGICKPSPSTDKIPIVRPWMSMYLL
jgi:hypothetical protein